MALTSIYNFTTYDQFSDTSWIEELQTRKPLSPISSISGSNKRTGFEPLRHICSHWLQKSAKYL